MVMMVVMGVVDRLVGTEGDFLNAGDGRLGLQQGKRVRNGFQQVGVGAGLHGRFHGERRLHRCGVCLA
jgi:hypothetical protein